VVALDLGKGEKGSAREMLTVVRSFARFRPFEIELEDGSRQRFDSLGFANIAQMAKLATLAEETGTHDDGMFEVITLRHTAKCPILATAVKPAWPACANSPAPARVHPGDPVAAADRQ
jgi:hypothetical protein